MEKKNKCVRAGCSRILWPVLAILLCAAPSFATSEEVPPGVEKDINYTVSGNLTVYGTVNLLSGANITQSVDVKSGGTANLRPGSNIGWFVYTTASSTVNIKGGQVGWWIDVAPGATVTVYGTGFNLGEGEFFIDYGTVTGFYENDDPINLTFDCQPGATVTLAAPGVGPQPVDIDIKPGSYPNAINLGSNGVIPVAILSSDTFDATTVDPETVFLAGAGVAVRGKGNKLASQEDVNGDGLTDLVVKLETENLDPDTFQNGTATLTGQTVNGVKFTGSDSIRIVPPA